MVNRISMKFDTEKMVGSLSRYTDEVRSSLRPAAQSGAQVLYDEMRSRVPVGHEDSHLRGKTYPPGTLRDSIYQVFSTDNSDVDRATYQVGPNKKKAGWWAWVEFGHWTRRSGKRGPLRAKWVPARPYIRPTWDARGRDAVRRMREALAVQLSSRGKA